MSKCLYKDRFFLDDDPEFTSFFLGVILDGDGWNGPCLRMMIGDEDGKAASWYWELNENSLNMLKAYSEAFQRLYEAAKKVHND